MVNKFQALKNNFFHKIIFFQALVEQSASALGC